MKQIKFLVKISVIIIFLIVIIKNFNINENFFPYVGKNNYSNLSYSDGKVIFDEKPPEIEKNCCKVTKVFDKEQNKFVYKYKKLKQCSNNKINNTAFSNTFIDGINGWKDEYCKDLDIMNDNKLGSCKLINFECKDFMTKAQCKKFGLEWFDKTCQEPYNKPFKTKTYELEVNGKILTI